MKAEHRKELKTNLLADQMGRLVHSMKTTPRTTTSVIWILVVVALGTIVVWQYYARFVRAHRSALWVQLDAADHEPEIGGSKLEQIANQNPGTIPGRTARFELARQALQNGQILVSTRYRKEAVERLDLARQYYRDLTKECSESNLLRQEAWMGLALAEESLVGMKLPDSDGELKDIHGDLSQALEYYQKVVGEGANTALGRLAAQRIQELESKRADVQSFYHELNALADAKIPELPPELKFPPPRGPAGSGKD